jgi:membrane protease subunit HflC
MMARNRIILIFIVGLLAACAWRTFLPVDETTYAIVTRFGRVIGEPIWQPGLHFKFPWDSCILLDKRLQLFDPRPSEFLLASKKATPDEKQEIGQNVVVDYFVTWRILGHHSPNAPDADKDPARTRGPLVFLKAVNNPLNAQSKLLEIIHSEISAALGRQDMSALVSVNPGDLKTSQIEQSVTAACREIAAGKYGIEIEDIRIKRVSLPEQNKQSVFERMRAERLRKATQLRAEGQRDAMTVRAEADKEASRLLAESYRDAERTRGEGDAKATAIYAQAHNKDPEFYRLVRTLDAYRKFLNEKTTIVLSANSELLQLLTRGAVSKSGDQPTSGAARPAVMEKKP